METHVVTGREVWWCSIVNEPFVINFDGNYPKCTLCGWMDDAAVNGIASSSFLSEHSYCLKVGNRKVIDYRALLKKYIAHVTACEGVDFVTSGTASDYYNVLNEEDKAEIRKLVSENENQ